MPLRWKRPNPPRRDRSLRTRRLRAESLEQRRLLASIVVNSLADTVDFGGGQTIADLPGGDGQVTLREAITAANNTAGPDDITFNIPSGPLTISLGSRLPTITESLSIDGTNTGANGQIHLDASGLTADVLSASNLTGLQLRDLTFRGYAGTAIRLTAADDATLERLDLSDPAQGQFSETGIQAADSDSLIIRDSALVDLQVVVWAPGFQDF